MRWPTRLTLCGAALCLTGATALHALPDTTAGDRAEAFATCSGRLEALAVHGRSHDRFDGDAIDRLAQEFGLLFDAILPVAGEAASAAQGRSWHGRGWGEIAWLLNAARDGADAARADRAARSLWRKIVNCTDLVAPGAPPAWLADVTRAARERPREPATTGQTGPALLP